MAELNEILADYYSAHGRHDLPWRQLSDDEDERFYQVLVSEMMLQQTQVSRVVTKYEHWMKRFPNITVLSKAPLHDVIQHWMGLGYNRRARFLWLAAEDLVKISTLPRSVEDLRKLPGIGLNTAGAMKAYIFNEPVVFVETNIRTVFLHHFFNDSQNRVHDNDLVPLIEKNLDVSNPRVWYWSLMDYGTFLKANGSNNAKSSHYTKQTKFEGSRRQLRSRILRTILECPQDLERIKAEHPDSRTTGVLAALEKEGFITMRNGAYVISTSVE